MLTTKPLTTAELVAIRARTDAASPGPWLTPAEVYQQGGGDEHIPLDHESCAVWPWNCEEDMIFAYKAREDVPRLLAEVERLRQILGEEV